MEEEKLEKDEDRVTMKTGRERGTCASRLLPARCALGSQAILLYIDTSFNTRKYVNLIS